jgi:hypothetical protein
MECLADEMEEKPDLARRLTGILLHSILSFLGFWLVL